MRNLFGQVDETVQPERGEGSNGFAVWSHPRRTPPVHSPMGKRRNITADPKDLDGHGRVGRACPQRKEPSVGHDLSVGAPLPGTREHDEPDFKATSALVFPIFEVLAHIGLVHPVEPEEQILCRSYNYDDPSSGTRIRDSGLILMSYQADGDRQFLPIQRWIAPGDRLNEWIIAINSAVFAVPTGCQPDEFIGDFLI